MYRVLQTSIIFFLTHIKIYILEIWCHHVHKLAWIWFHCIFLFFSRYMWIGLLRGSSDERFSWVDSPSPTLYSNWAITEPNNFNGRGENCGHMYIWKGEKAMQWNDELCVNPTIGPMIFMCEIKPVDLGPKPAKTGNSIDEDRSGNGGSGSGEVSSGSESGDDLINRDFPIDWVEDEKRRV